MRDVKYPSGREELLTWLVDAKLSFPEVPVLSMDGVVLVSVGDICTVNAESLSTIPDADGDSLDEVILLLAAAKKNIRSIPRDKPAPAGSILQSQMRQIIKVLHSLTVMLLDLPTSSLSLK